MTKKDSNRNNQEEFSKMSINWYPRSYGKNKETNYRRLKAN